MALHYTCMPSLETLSFYNLQTENDMETKLTSIYFSHRVAEGSKSSWLQHLVTNLSIIPHTLGIQMLLVVLFYFELLIRP